ncbi:ABC transporter ATP-binding protein [Streptomyces sp. B-S-A8]|uniref:ABC transporter ATP-binding protein n=1 Tax=Streptomyces solicavernae TaxID=3043614 RepID=A0ABT6RL97_9ACTN|nr:ABC transporter ATP-binding protein [Streptomyces sp. B-S-A8]MDI3385212.1 ABC transporter ATP-binding protein [Streptomyces sp. B-S-A8]
MAKNVNEPVLLADDLVAGYLPGVDVLRGCSVEVGRGELVGVIGPNGAGKSTLAKAVFGLLKVRTGTVRLDGRDVTNRPAHELVRRGVGYVPQLQNVFPALTVEENLRMGAYLKPRSFARRTAELEEFFPVLRARRSQKAGSMSGGERQLLAMARALMTEPQLLLLDEPSAGLSPLFQDQVFERVKEINAAGVAVLMVEQNARRCLQICIRGYVLDLGRNAHTGTGAQLLHDEKVIECYLGTLARAR